MFFENNEPDTCDSTRCGDGCEVCTLALSVDVYWVIPCASMTLRALAIVGDRACKVVAARARPTVAIDVASSLSCPIQRGVVVRAPDPLWRRFMPGLLPAPLLCRLLVI